MRGSGEGGGVLVVGDGDGVVRVGMRNGTLSCLSRAGSMTPWAVGPVLYSQPLGFHPWVPPSPELSFRGGDGIASYLAMYLMGMLFVLVETETEAAAQAQGSAHWDGSSTTGIHATLQNSFLRQKSRYPPGPVRNTCPERRTDRNNQI